MNSRSSKMSLSGDYEKEKWTFVNHKLAIAKSICQQLNNNNKGIYLQRLNPELLQLRTFNTPWGEFRVESGAVCAPGKLVEQVFRRLVIFRTDFMIPISSGHVWMWELDCQESRAPKNWCFWTVVLEKTLESPLDCKEIQPAHTEALGFLWKEWC